MANSDIIKIGFDYRASLAQFEKDTNGVFDGISNKAGKQKITIQLDAKDDKVIDKIKELQKLKLDKFTFEFGDSGLKEQLQTFDKLESKINEIINLGKGKSFIDSSSITKDIGKIENKINELNKKINTSFDTKNKTEAYNQLKKYADAFKDYYNNEEAMASESGTKAAYAYYKAYEEALKKEVAQSKLEKVTVDFDVNDKFFDKNRIVSDRIKEYANYKKYGNDNDLLEEISSLKNKLFDFNSAYSQVKEKLGQAAITPEIIKSVERYVELLDKARFLEQLNDPDDNDTIKSHRAMAQASLDDALFNAQEQSYKYTKSLRQQEEQLTSTVEAEEKLAEVQKETTSNSVTSDNSQIEELKSDIQEVKTELGDVKDRISSIESNGFENVREDVEKTKESVKELNSELTEMKSNLSSAPQESNISLGGETFKNDVEQVQLSLQRYKDTIAEIDKMKLEPETEESKKKIEELTQLTMYFKKQALDAIEITKFVDWGYEGGGKAHTFASFGASTISGNPSENSMRYAGNLENWKLMRQFTREWSDGNRDWYKEVKTTFSGINEEINTIINQVLRLPAVFSESEEASKKYIKQISIGFQDLSFSFGEGQVNRVDKILERFPELEQMRHLWEKMDEDTAEKFSNIKIAKDGMISGNDEWLRFIQTLPKAQEYLKAIGYEFKEVAQINQTTPTKDAFPNANTKLDEVVTSAKDLDKTLEQVDIPTDSFDKVLEKLDRTKSELVDIVKITKQSVSDADGKFHDSYTLKDSRGSTEIYGVNSKTDKGQILRQNIVGYDKKKDELDISKAQLEVDKQLAKEEDNLAKAQQKKAQAFLKEQANYEEDQKKAELIKRQTLAYEELTDTISKYSEVAKRVAGGNAEDGDLELMTKLEDKISQLQKQPILSDSQVSKSEKSLVSLYDQLDKIERKLVETNQKSQDKQIAGFDKRLESYTKKTSGYNATIARFNDGGWTSDTYLKNVQAVKDAVKKYEDLLNDIKAKGGIASEDDIQNLKEYESEIKNTIATVTNMSAAEKGYNFVSGQKELDKIHKLLNENSKMSSEAKAKIRAYYAEIESGNPSMSLDKIHGEILKIYNAEVEAGRAGRTLWDTLKNSGFHQIAAQMAGMFGVYDIINIFKQGANTLKEFDDGLTKISYTMDMTKSQLDNLGNSVLDMASNMKSSIDDAMQVAQIYANMQTSAEEIQRLSEPTLILSNLSGFDSSTIADDIQAVTQQFDILAEDSMHIADVYDYISRNIAVDYSKGLNAMAEGLQVAGSTAKQAGLSYEQTASIIAKAVEKTRLEGSQVGNGLKTIMTRLSKVGELSEEVDNETLSQASESLKKVGIEVYNLDGSYREFDVIMGELAGKWDDLTDAEKSNISFNIAATRQTNLLSAVLSNFSDSMQLAEEATNANGSALENQQKYMESFSGHLQSLETEAKIAWLNILDSETLKDGVDLLTGLVKVTGQLVDTFGLLGTAAGIGGIVAGFKNVGIDTLVAY